MTTLWQRTTLSTRSPDGRYIDECAEAEDTFEWVFDAQKPVDSVEAAFWRITPSSERTSPQSPDRVEVDSGIGLVQIIGNFVAIAVTEFERRQQYELVFVVEAVDGSVKGFTRGLVVVA